MTPANGNVPRLPFLKPWYRISRDGERTILDYGRSVVVCEGRANRRLLPALLPLLDGSRTVADIATALGDTVAPAVANALGVLAERGLLTEGPPPAEETPASTAETARFLAATSPADQPVAHVRDLIEAARIGIVGAGALSAEIARLLRRSGAGELERLGWSPAEEAAPGETDLVIVTPAPDEAHRLPEWNERALERRCAWLHVVPFDGRLATVGPLFLPWQTCCYECYVLRRRANSELGEDFWMLERQPANQLVAPSVLATIAGIAVTVALRWIAAGDRTLAGCFHAVEQRQILALTHHRVLRVPRCPRCSPVADLAPPLPWFKEVGP